MEELIVKRVFLKLSISSRLKCPICYEVFLKPRRLFCGHTFCKSCLLQMFKPHKNPEHVPSCPLCRVPIDRSNIGKDLIAQKIINQLQVMCPVNGCPWRGQNQLLDTHFQYECRMKHYIHNIAQGKSLALMVCDSEGPDAEVTQKINQNIQKGSLISRVVSKNPQLLNFNQEEVEKDEPIYWKKEYQVVVKNMVTRSTQTKKSDHSDIGTRTHHRKIMTVSQSSMKNNEGHFRKEKPSQFDLFNDASSNYQQQGPKINVINLEDKQKKNHVRRSRPRIFRQ